MAPRSSWKGFVKLSLVSVPVKAFTANDTSDEVRLNQLHKGCHSRIRYQKVCPAHGELKSEDIVSGYEYAKDQYVVVDPDEVSKLRPKSEKSIEIDGFVEPVKIDPTYMAGKTYYLLPDGPAGSRPYALLQKGMAERGVCAVAQVVMSGREHLALLRPVENLLVLSVLSYAATVKGIDQFKDEMPGQDITPEELSLTNTLIQASTIERFDLASYRDDYADKLNQLIRMKIDGQEIVQAPDQEEPKIINLMDALKRSVAQAQAGGFKKMAPSVKAPSEPAAEEPARAAPEKKVARKKKTG
jgi:DNA end-binding protein Ku